MEHEYPGDKAITKLCVWIEHSQTSRQIAARYRSALGRDYVVTDADFRRVWNAAQSARAAIAKARGAA